MSGHRDSRETYYGCLKCSRGCIGTDGHQESTRYLQYCLSLFVKNVPKRPELTTMLPYWPSVLMVAVYRRRSHLGFLLPRGLGIEVVLSSWTDLCDFFRGFQKYLSWV